MEFSFAVLCVIAGRDETDFVKPVGVPRIAAKRTGSASSSASSSSTVPRRAMASQRPAG